MPTRQEILRLARLLASAPTVSYREHEVLHRIRVELNRAGVDHGSDRYGNLIARYHGRRSRGRPVAFTAHTDHPGLIVERSNGRSADARWLGGVENRYFRAAPVRIETADGPVRGKVRSVGLSETGRVSGLRLLLERAVPPGSIGGFDLVPFRLDRPWVRTKSADDLLGCAGVLSLMLELARSKPSIDVWGVFTRAEEDGLLGASILAEDRVLPENTAVVVIETSRELPSGRLGEGVIVRVGDRRSVYDPGINQTLHETAVELSKNLRGFRYQRALMDGGVCEASAFLAFGYQAGGLALALGNYHNMGKEGRVAEEFVHIEDLWNLSRLLLPAARKLAETRDGMAGLRQSFRKRMSQARKDLMASRAAFPPSHAPVPPRKKPVARAKRPAAARAILRVAVGLLLLGAATARAADRPWWGRPQEPASGKEILGIHHERVVTADGLDPRDEYDVLRYRLRIELLTESAEIRGEVTMEIEAITDLSSMVLDMGSNLALDEAHIPGGPSLTFLRLNPDQIALDLPGPVADGTQAVVVLTYHGRPGDGSFKGFKFFSKHGTGTDSTIVVSSLSQPEMSHLWWPCKERMDDKALVTVTVDAPGEFTVAGNGVRVRDESIGPLRRTMWESAYPISSYLVSIAATNYSFWTDTYRAADGDSLPLYFYAFPEDSADARFDYEAATAPALRVFEGLFGPYPFRLREFGVEKLGVAEVPWGRLAMEHQTCISYGDGFIRGDGSSSWALAHEISHQWWGDAVTPTSMDHIWLNEGFATYCEALLAEADGGHPAYKAWMDGRIVSFETDYRSSLVAPDPQYWFLRSLTYNKGAWVLHMLRGILGDDRFFEALREYYMRHRYANASTEDFMRDVEESVGRDLRWFFHPWLYGEGRPVIAWDWWAAEQDGRHQARLLLRQTQEGPLYPNGAPGGDPPDFFPFYSFPVRVIGDAQTTMRWIEINARETVAVIDSLPFIPRNLVLDPEEWTLRIVRPRGEELTLHDLSVFPNPARAGMTFLVRGSGSTPVVVTVHDVSGRTLRSVGSVNGEGFHKLPWDGTDGSGGVLASGVYLARRTGPGGQSSIRVVRIH